MSIKCEMTLTEEEATDSVSEYETDSELECSEGEEMASPYSSKPLPELSEAEISAAKELREWLAEISDPKTRVIQTLFLADSDNDDDNDNNNDDEQHDDDRLYISYLQQYLLVFTSDVSAQMDTIHSAMDDMDKLLPMNPTAITKQKKIGREE